MYRKKLAGCLVLALLLPVPSALALTYDESVSGDLSDDPNAPSALAFSLGDNTITGSMGNSNNVTTGDRDFLSFTVGPGQQLASLFLLSLSPSNRGFHAISSGATSVIPSGPGAGDVSTYLGSAHLDSVPSTTNLLPDLGTPLAGTGFSGPLGPGVYSYVVQQTSSLTQNYSLNFVIVPEPTSLALCLPGLLATVAFRRRR
ncbi:MAG: hypothetical protein MI725_05645 [Pirellulales bacterium]|nr:hypothetical protein [Pirellulales bacterium]